MLKSIRLGAGLLAILLLLTAFAACQKTDQSFVNDFPSLRIGKKNNVTATVTLDDETVEKHAGTKAFLYELKPGDTIKDLKDRDPLDNCKIRREMSFEFPLMDEERSRIYSSFAVVFNDGSILNVGGFRMIDNPTILASNTAGFQWSRSPKGLVLDNADDAVALGAMHGMLQVKLSELAHGADTFHSNGVDYAISATKLAALDEQIQKAASTGMQVSLTLVADTVPPTAYLSALIDHIVAQFTQPNRRQISAIFVEQTDSVTTAQLATISRLAYQALASRVANGRVFVLSNQTLLLDTMSFFSEIAPLLDANGSFPWGAAIKPAASKNAPWETPEAQDTIHVTNVDKIKDFLQSMESCTIPSWFAVCGVGFTADNEAHQAASFAYAYRVLNEKGVDLIFYQAQQNDSMGLYSENGTPRRIASIFSSIDTGLNASDAALCRETVGEAWNVLNPATTRQTVNGVASVAADANGDLLFDFSTGDANGFSFVGGAGAPAFEPTVGFGATIDPTVTHSASGIRKILTNSYCLRNATAITLQSQTIADAADTAITLILEGTDANGKQITYQSTTQISCGELQTVTFHVNAFVAEADLSAPVIMTITTEPNTQAAFSFETTEIRVSKLAKDNSLLLPLILIPTCVLLTTAALLLIHRKATLARRKKRLLQRMQAKAIDTNNQQ